MSADTPHNHFSFVQCPLGCMQFPHPHSEHLSQPRALTDGPRYGWRMRINTLGTNGTSPTGGISPRIWRGESRQQSAEEWGGLQVRFEVPEKARETWHAATHDSHVEFDHAGT